MTPDGRVTLIIERRADPGATPINLHGPVNRTIGLSYTRLWYVRTVKESRCLATSSLRIEAAHCPLDRSGNATGDRARNAPLTKFIMTETDIDRASIGATDDPARTPIRVLIALAVPFLRTGVRKVLDEAEDMQVVDEVSEIAQILPAVEQHGPDIVVVDSDFHRAELQLVEAIREARPTIGVIVMVNHSDDECVIRSMLADPSGPQFSDDAISKLSECCLMALRSSARGCVPKVAEPDRLVRAIRTVAAGGLSAGGWLGSMVGRMSHAAPEAGRVTGRELEIISLVARGLENKEIAAELEIAEQTVKNHLSRVMKKLGLRNRQEVAMFAVRVHLDTPG